MLFPQCGDQRRKKGRRHQAIDEVSGRCEVRLFSQGDPGQAHDPDLCGDVQAGGDRAASILARERAYRRLGHSRALCATGKGRVFRQRSECLPMAFRGCLDAARSRRKARDAVGGDQGHQQGDPLPLCEAADRQNRRSSFASGEVLLHQWNSLRASDQFLRYLAARYSPTWGRPWKVWLSEGLDAWSAWGRADRGRSRKRRLARRHSAGH